MARRTDERGAVAIMMALVICFVTVPLAAVAVDLGAQRVARRDVQAVADTVALDMARLLGGATPPTDALAQAAYRGQRVMGRRPTLQAYVGYIAEGASWVSDQSLGCDGRPFNSFFTAVPSGRTANAVLVTASGGVDFRLAGAMPGAPASGGVCRSSIATAVSTTCFTVGSMLAGLDGSSGLVGLLEPVLDPHHTVAAGLVGYQGLAQADVDLPVLHRALIDAGYPEGVLATDVRVGDLLEATATALVASGPTADLAATAGLLGAVAHATAIAHVPIAVATRLGTTPAPPAIVDLATQNGAAVSGRVNALDLVASAVLIADGDHLLDASLPTSIPGLAHLTTTATLIERARTACGVAGAQARSAQVRVNLAGTVLPDAGAGHPAGGTGIALGGGALLPGLNLNAWVDQVPVSAVVEAAAATATLGQVACDPDVIPVNVKTGLLQLRVSAPVTIEPSVVDITDLISVPNPLYPLGPATVPLLSLVTGVRVRLYVGDRSHWQSTGTLRGITVPVGVSASRPADDTGSDLAWRIPSPDRYDTVKSTGASAQALPHLGGVSLPGTAVWTDISGGTLGTLLAPVSTLLTGVVSLVQTTLQTAVSGLVLGPVNAMVDSLNPLLQQIQQGLGLRLPGADVRVLPEARCGEPVSRG